MVSIKWCMESAGELSHNNPKRKNGFGYGYLIIDMSLTPLPVKLALSFLKTESLDPPPCRLGSLDSFDLVWEKKGSVLFWPSVQERLVTSWLLKHPSPSLKKRKKKKTPKVWRKLSDGISIHFNVSCSAGAVSLRIMLFKFCHLFSQALWEQMFLIIRAVKATWPETVTWKAAEKEIH